MHKARTVGIDSLVTRLEELVAAGVDIDKIPLDLTINDLFRMPVDEIERRTHAPFTYQRPPSGLGSD